MIIAVSGYRGSGKSVFGQVAREMGLPVLEMSEPVLALMKELGLETTNESVRNFATDFREKGGPDAVARLMLPKIKEALAQGKSVVVIGARSEEEINAFLTVSGAACICIISDEKNRFARIKSRGKASDPQKLEDFRWADRVEEKWGLKKLLETCDVKLHNDASEEDFRERAKALLGKYK